MNKDYFSALLLYLTLGISISFGQITPRSVPKDWNAISSINHQKNKWLVGAGLTYLGLTAKAGRFVAPRTWLGLEAESHHLLSDRQEIGVFARYYLWNGGLISGFSALGVSYGSFQAWNWNFDGSKPPQPLYQSPKLNAAFGLECPIGKQLALEGVAKVGRLTQADWVQPSFQGSINYYFGR